MAERQKPRPKRFVSRPQEIEAVQWTGDPKSFYEVSRLTGNDKATITDDDSPTLDLEIKAGKDGAQGWVPVPVDHWVVRNPGDDSDCWPVDPGYFAGKYKPAGSPISITVGGSGCPRCAGADAGESMAQAITARRLRSDG